MRKFKWIISVILSGAIIFTGSLAGFIPAGKAQAETYLKGEYEYEEGRVIVCVQEKAGPDGRTEDETSSPALFSMLPFENNETAESLLADADELMDVSPVMEDMLSEEADILPENEVSSARQYASDSEEDVRTCLKVVDSDKYSTEELIDKLSALPQVVFAEPDYIINIPEENPERAEESVFHQSAYSSGDAPENSGFTGDLTEYQYAFRDGPGGIDVPDWNDPSNQNAEGTVVAVVDTGIDYNNPDLKNVMWDKGLDYKALTAMGGGKYGICTAEADTKGAQYRSDDPMDDNFHGTFCAGIIAASWNGTGVSGAANGARVMAVKVFDDQGAAWISDIITGFNYLLEAKNAGVNIVAINNSYAMALLSYGFRLAVSKILEEGITPVFASGNENLDTDHSRYVSGGFSEVFGKITVNSCDATNQKSDFSNYGVRSTDVFAPGDFILSTEFEKDLSVIKTPSKDLDGTLMINDFETEGYFNITDVSDKFDISLSREEDPQRAGNHALKASFHFPKENLMRAFKVISITPKDINAKIADKGTRLFLVIKSRSNAPTSKIYISVKTESGTYKESKMYWFDNAMQCYAFELPEDADLEALDIRICIGSNVMQDTDEEMSVWFDDCFISADYNTAPYAFYSGTSFSCPAVTGEAVILASAFPEDDIKKRAARILGSVVCYDQYKGLCITGGLVNVCNALDEEYMPVVTGIRSEDNGNLIISGYFFGKVPGTSVRLFQYGKEYECEIAGLQNDQSDPDAAEITVKAPDGLKSGEVIVSVTDSSKAPGRQTGSRYLNLSLTDMEERFYERLPHWEDPGYDSMQVMNIAGVDNTLYCYGADTDQYILRLFSIEDMKYSWMENSVTAEETENVCVFDRKLMYFSSTDGSLTIFDPASGRNASYNLSLYSDFTRGKACDLFNTGERLLIFNTPEGRLTEVWELDPFTLKAEKLFDLKAEYGARNIYGLNETKTGREIYIGLGTMPGGKSSCVMEKILISSTTGEISHELVSRDILPEGFNAIGKDRPVGCGTKRGIYLAGGYKLKEDTDEIETDNWYFDYSDPGKGFQPCEKRIASEPLFDAAVGCHKGKVYFSGRTTETEKFGVIAYKDEETWDFGDESVVPSPEPEKAITSLEIAGNKTFTLKEGERAALSCIPVFPESMKEEDRPPLIYRAENENLIKINPNTGELLAINPGSTRVIASCGNKSVSFDIAVDLDSSPSELPTSLVLSAGEQYNTSFNPGYSTGKEKVIWTSLDKKTATVKNGLITAKKSGTTLVRVTVKEGKNVKSSQECYLTVKAISIPKAQSKDKSVKLSLNTSSIKTKVGETIELKASLTGSDREKALIISNVTNGNLIEKGEGNDTGRGQASGKKLVYNYSFKALAPGTAYITVTTTNPAAGAQNIKLCKVMISAPAEKMEMEYLSSGRLAGDLYILKKGAIGRIQPVISPENSTDTTFSWKAKGGAVTVKNGVIYTKRVSKKDKNTGEYIPDTITAKCGKLTEIIKVVVEE